MCAADQNSKTFHFLAPAGDCPAPHLYPFNDGFHCCSSVFDEHDNDVMIAYDGDETHCLAANTIEFPTIPRMRAALQPASEFY